jgi:protein TonB
MLPLKKTTPQEPDLIISHKRPVAWEDADFYDELIQIKQARYKKFRARKLLFSSIGFMLSLALVLMVFEWKTYEKDGDVDVNQTASIVEELLDIPVTQQPPPPPQKVIKQPKIVAVPEEEMIEELEIDLDMDISEDTEIEEIIVETAAEVEEETADEIFLIVEKAPEPVGGLQAFYTYVSENIKYPVKAARMNISGKVFVQFVVNKDGSLTDFTVVKGIGGGCDEEAVRVLKSAPKWVPGKQRGKNVRVRMVIPIIFMLRE